MFTQICDLPWVQTPEEFPDTSMAMVEPDGLLALGRALSPQLVLAAYQRGIFPWFSPGDPVLWWSPDPRMVLFTDEFRLHKSLRKALQRARDDCLWQIRCDFNFESVIRACAADRPGQRGTWITDSIVATYVDLHRSGFAHSIEVWYENQLVGGLYGLSIGRMFYGESMFTRKTDASKMALASLVDFLVPQGCRVIDCQQQTGHLASMGARPIPRAKFLQLVKEECAQEPIDWTQCNAQFGSHATAD